MISTRAPCSTSSLSNILLHETVTGNVAKGSSATQLSTQMSWSAEKAVDGDKSSRTSCSSTGYTMNPFLRVDLLKIYRVDRVVVTNRIDCCPEQTAGAEIRIGNSLKNDGNDNPM